MIYAKTALGQAALQNRASLPPRQRSAFILFDGKRSTEEVLKASSGLGVTAEDIQHMVDAGLLAVASASARTAAVAPATPAAPATPVGIRSVAPSLVSGAASASAGAPSLSAQAHYLRAYPIATRLTAGLGLRGFRLNLAVEAAGDLAKLQALAPKIREAVGPTKYQELDDALYR